jgi:outer membrane protein OmpA-like peptidoglycan-associated protein
VSNNVEPGKQASLSISAPLPLKQVEVVLTSGDYTTKRKVRSLKVGKPYKLSFKPPLGRSVWKAKVTGIDPEGLDQSVEFDLEVMSAPPLRASVVLHESSLEAGRLVALSNNPLDHAELKAFGDEGELLWQDNVTFKMLDQDKATSKRSRRSKRSKRAKKSRYVARYDRSPTPRRLEVKLVDAYESWMSMRLVRWFAEVPHADVLFESGSSEIRASEAPKMSEAIEGIRAEIEKFRRAMGQENAQVDIQLYVGGYTDSLGDAQDNLKLSVARARSIARYFKQQGVDVAILYAGFGERAPLVQTPDNTDEARNRRAVYVIANTPPQGPSFPQARWRRLP